MQKVVNKSKSINWKDALLTIVCFSQFFLVIFQVFCIDTSIFSYEEANRIRVLYSAIPIILALPILLERNALLTIILTGTAFLILGLTCVIFPENTEYIKDQGFKITLSVNIPIFLSFISIRDSIVFKKTMNIIANCCVFIGLLYFVAYISMSMSIDRGYTMSLGYALLFPILLYLTKKKNRDIVVAISLIVIVVILGSRGPAIASICFLLTKMLLSITKIRNISKWFFVVFLSLFLSYVFLPYKQIVDQLHDSRTFALFSSGQLITHDSGRGEIYSFVWEKILESPILGYGIFGDRQFVDGIYVHNLFLELWCGFGLILGSLIIVLLIICTIKSFFRLSSAKAKEFYLVLFFLGVFPLWVSSSYLISSSFPLFIGALCIIINKKKSNLYIE